MCGSSFGYCKDEKKKLSVIEKKALLVGEIASVSKGTNKIVNPDAPQGYRLELKGSDRPQVVDNKGNIIKPLVDAEVQLYYQLVDVSSNERTDVPNKKVLVPGEYTQKQTGNACPEIIPSLREWHGLNGTFELGKKGKVIIHSEDYDKLASSMKLFTEDLHFFGDRTFTVKSGSYKSGAIYVSLDCDDKALGEEGYRLIIEDGIKLVANTPKGIFMGTRTILQLANVYKSEIPKGITRDYPKYARRGFMLDTGRKFFRLAFLKDYVRIMSYYKMNEFHIHLNDNGFKQFFGNDWNKTYAAFRLESETFPGLTAKDGSYSKKEFTALQKLGMDYGINVIPEIDIPAHSLAFTQYKPSLGSEEYGMDHLDITKQETYDFFDKLFDEYLSGDQPVFIGPDVHIGTDEYSKKKAEEFRKFTDHYLKLVQSYGKRARLWGALTHAKGETPVTSENVIMNAWYNGYANPRDMIEQGYELISTSDRHLYIVPAAGYYYDYLNLKFLFEKWEPNLIGGDVFPFGHPSVSGGMFAVWNDHCGNGISEKDVHHRTFPALQVLAQKMWQGKKDNYTQDTFNGIAKKLIEAPYVNVMGNIPSKGSEVLSYDFTASNKKDNSANGYDVVANDGAKYKKGVGIEFNGSVNLTTPVEEIGYPYQVDFDVTFNSTASKEMILFSSENAEFVAVPKNDKIVLGFKRDGYFYTFDYAINAGERVSIGIQGNNKGTALLVNGKEVERLQGKVEEHKKEDGKINKMYIQQTLVFPLRTIGNEKNGFDGVMHQLKVSKI
ncbi:glycoside hydrolase [Puteibacter caeruleilacunae]|nr:glycoside hydrolase [Puteibacter caeruleilacunae]